MEEHVIHHANTIRAGQLLLFFIMHSHSSHDLLVNEEQSDISSNRLNEVLECVPQPLLPISKWQTVKCLGIQKYIFAEFKKTPNPKQLKEPVQDVGSGDGEEKLVKV